MTTPIDARPAIVAWGAWGVKNNAHFTYTEGAQRMAEIGHPGALPVTCDCSAWVTLCYNWAGADDPNGQGYNHTGYTGTLLAHGTHIPLAQVQPGDVVVYGAGTGVHAVLVYDTTNKSDPLCVSMGQQGDPHFVHDSVLRGLGAPTYLRFHTGTTRPVHYPPTK